MKHWLLILFVGVFVVGCGETEKPKRPEPIKIENLPLITESEDGKYTEWYPGREQVKISGRYDENKGRTGIWKYYSPEGVELSVTVYMNGLRDGHTVVKHPNGALHYTGEYYEDERVGEWKFYDENGELTETIQYPER